MATRNGTSGDDVLDAAAFGELAEINIYRGAGGDDTLTGGALTDTLIGGEGSDVLAGGDGADTLIDTGKTGDDRLAGGSGDDTIRTRFGADSLMGGAGDDMMFAREGNHTLSGGAGDDTMRFGFGSMRVNGGQGDDVFVSLREGAGAATIVGGAGDDVLSAGASADFFDGGQGEDLVDYSSGRAGVVINLASGFAGGGAARDTFRLVEDIVGTRHSDVIIGDGAYNVFFGGAGDDTLSGGSGGDFLDGGEGFDLADLGARASVRVMANLSTGVFSDGDTLLNFEGVAGSSFPDVLIGDAAQNLLIARGGADALDGGSGADTMMGGADNDKYSVDSLDDLVVEATSEGIDVINVAFDYVLVANVENLNLIGSDALSGIGNDLANSIVGNEYDNILDGRAGADSLFGGLGNDTYYVDSIGDRISESLEDDSFDEVITISDFRLAAQVNLEGQIERITLAGDADIFVSTHNDFIGTVIGNPGNNYFEVYGNPTITGGGGEDMFFFPLGIGMAADGPAVVADFLVGEDSIGLESNGLSLPPGALSPAAFQIGGSAPAAAAVRVIYDPTTGSLFADRDGSGVRSATYLVATLSPDLDLSADDFVLI